MKGFMERAWTIAWTTAAVLNFAQVSSGNAVVFDEVILVISTAIAIDAWMDR